MIYVESSAAGRVSPERLKRVGGIVVGQSIVVEEYELGTRPFLIDELLWAGRRQDIELSVVKHFTNAGAVYELACTWRKSKPTARDERFDPDDIEAAQRAQDEVTCRVLDDYINASEKHLKSYLVLKSTREAGIVPKAYLSRRLLRNGAMKNNGRGIPAKEALNETIARLQDAGVLGFQKPRYNGIERGYPFFPNSLAAYTAALSEAGEQ